MGSDSQAACIVNTVAPQPWKAAYPKARSRQRQDTKSRVGIKCVVGCRCPGPTGGSGSAAPVELIELLNYRLHRTPIGIGKL